MLISVRTLQGREINLDVKPNDTIYDVKKKIEDKIKLRVDLQRLNYQDDKPLENNRTVSSYKIIEEATLQLHEKSAVNSSIVAGGYAPGNDGQSLNFPYGLTVDDNQAIIISDWRNHRIVQWNVNQKIGQVIAGGNGQGKQANQLNGPTDVCIDKGTNSLIICDRGNRRVVCWSRQDGTTQGKVILETISCWGVAIDNQNFLYVSDAEKNEVRQYNMNEMNKEKGIVVAGGNGRGGGRNQLNEPTYIFVDDKQAVYVSDTRNSRVVKWDKGAKEGIVVARGFCRGLFVDKTETVYVADYGNHGVMRWTKGASEGTIITRGSVEEQQRNQIYRPWGISGKLEGYLYVSDHSNHQVQRFSLNEPNN